MAFPLLLIAGGGAGLVGLLELLSGHDKISESKEKVKEAHARHERNLRKLEASEENAVRSMDGLGKLEIEIMAGFKEYQDIMEKIFTRPEFAKSNSDKANIPLFKNQKFIQATSGAGTLLSGVGSAAAGAFASFAASGAVTAATAAVGTASTGVAISSLSGAAATNAVFAALGGGSLAAGGGGVALGATVLNFMTFGVGLLVGGYFFESSADKHAANAKTVYDNMLALEEKIINSCKFLNELGESSEYYAEQLHRIYKKYKVQLEKVVKIVALNSGNKGYSKFTHEEKLAVEDLIRFVDVLYKLCQVQFVLKSKDETKPNSVNTKNINEYLEQAKMVFPELLKRESVKTECALPGILYVNPGEEKIYRDKIIKINTDIECEGTLILENCEIWYHCYLNSDKGQIKLIDEAKLEVKNCVLHCEAYSDKPLICSVPNHGVPSIHVINSQFYDCSEFVGADDPAYRFKYVTIEKSEFFNCINLMRRLEIEKEYYCRIANCKFEYSQIADFYVRHGNYQKDGVIKEFINVYSGDFYLDNSQANFSEEVCEKIFDLRSVRGGDFIVGPGLYGIFRVKNSSFTDCQNMHCLRSVSAVNDSVFRDCSDAIVGLRGNVVNCQFSNCKCAIDAGDGALISKCSFNGWDTLESRRNLLSLDAYTCTEGFLIEECTFQNINIKESTGLIKIYGDKEASKYLFIKKSIFRNVTVASTATKTVGYELDMSSGIIEPIEFLDAKKKEVNNKQSYISFDSCEFINCKGHLVPCEAYWTELNMIFSNDKGTTRVVEFTNCKGIDNDGKASS